jgi:hypothetical protein
MTRAWPQEKKREYTIASGVYKTCKSRLQDLSKVWVLLSPGLDWFFSRLTVESSQAISWFVKLCV